MTSSQRNRLWVILGLFVVAVLVLLPNVMKDELPDGWVSRPIKLGLDLRGGIYLVLGVQTEEAVKSRLTSMANFIKREMRKEKIAVARAKQLGDRSLEFTLLTEQAVEALEEHLRNEYPQLVRDGKENTGRRTVIKYSLKDAQAETIKKNAVDQAIETLRNRVDQYGVAEPLIQKAGVDRVVVQLPDVTDVDEVKKTIGSVAKLEFRLAVDPGMDPGAAGSVNLKRRNGGTEAVEEDVLMTGDVIDKAQVEINPATNEAEVLLQLNNEGGRVFSNITGQNVNRRLAIVLDGVVQSAPVIRERIPGGRASISGGFSPDEARLLAIVLRSGALPAPLEFLEERTVGATLGADSIKSGLTSLLVGGVIVMFFMMLYYKKAGVLAVGALLLNMVFLLALLALLGGTLTLPGVAGLILTVGMAVDANVIIFQRIREEIQAGASGGAAVDGGFQKAHWTILDANITTLITALVLYAFGSGPIKGFAVTLSLGIITSVFCALYVVKVGFEVLKIRNSSGGLSI